MSTSNTISSREVILQTFDTFRSELDDNNDRRERLIKSSRDITILSKKVIFLLHRLVTSDIEGEQSTFSNAAKEARQKLAEIQGLFRNIKDEVAGERFWRHQSSVSPGLQEFIEALSFTHYLEHGTLITFEDVQQTLSDDGVPFFPLPFEEYLLGVSDLTGELMRFAISAISRRGGRKKAREVSDFVRNCRADFEGFTPYVKHLSKKQAVTTQSLLKIEEAAYAIAVRSSEYAGSEEILDDIVERYVSDVRNRREHGYNGGSAAYREEGDCEQDDSSMFS